LETDLEKNWIVFNKKHSKSARGKVDFFLTLLEKDYKEKKIKEFQEKGADYQTAIVKARQSWVVYVGDKLENVVRYLVEPLANSHGAKVIRDKEIQRSKLNKEHDSVRRNLLVHFEKFSYLPDADLVVYKYNEKENKSSIIAILSVKNSFRERYTETPYWKLKLMQNQTTKGIQFFMVTTDRDDEISFNERPSKARIILEYELDGVYITKHKEKFASSKKIGNLDDLLLDLKILLKKF
jgi:type II restriction enzyme